MSNNSELYSVREGEQETPVTFIVPINRNEIYPVYAPSCRRMTLCFETDNNGNLRTAQTQREVPNMLAQWQDDIYHATHLASGTPLSAVNPKSVN